MFWQYLEEVRQLGIKHKEKEAQARQEREKAEYLKNIQDTIYACKVCKSQGSCETTHLTDANTNEVTHCIKQNVRLDREGLDAPLQDV